MTQEALEQLIAEVGLFANRGTGTFYRLIDPATVRLAQVEPDPDNPNVWTDQVSSARSPRRGACSSTSPARRARPLVDSAGGFRRAAMQ